LAAPDMKHIKRAVCYIRKSREDELAERRGEDTLAKQREMLSRDVLCRYTFAYDMAEEVASGDSIRERPVFRELLHHLGYKYQAIVCKDLSRLGRGSYSDMGVVYDIIRDRRIFIITKDAIYDPHNFSDLRMIRFSLFFNREEYEMTLWRLTEGKYDGAGRGKWVAGSVPYGYAYDRHSQILKPFEEQAQIVRSIFDWYVIEKLGYQAIANRLTALTIPTPRGKSRWHSEVVRRILKNPAYHGTLAFRLTKRNKLDGKVVKRPREEQIIVEHAFDPLIDEDTWKKATERRKNQVTMTMEKPNADRYELSGIVICETCKHRLVRQSSRKTYKKKSGSISVYEQAFLYCKECGYAIQYRDCEQQVIEVLRHLSLPNMMQIFKEYQSLCAEDRAEGSTQFDLAASFHKQLTLRKENIERRLARARDMLLDGVFSKNEYLKAYNQCEQELGQISALLLQNSKPTTKKTEPDSSSHPISEALRHPISDALPHPVSDSIANAGNDSLNEADRIAPIRGFHSLADVYQYLKSPNLKNELLQVMVECVEIRIFQKRERQKRRFQLNVWMKPIEGLVYI
jgi:DNA invertase Pin-like site-specific DNA recombinase